MKCLQDAEGYISPRIIIITHPHRTNAARQTKGSSKKRRSRGRSCTGGEFRDTAELTAGGKKRKKGNSICVCKTSANKQCAAAGRPAGEGGGGGRESRFPGVRFRLPGAPCTVAAYQWQDGVDEEDVVFGKPGVPDTKCLVNTDLSQTRARCSVPLFIPDLLFS